MMKPALRQTGARIGSEIFAAVHAAVALVVAGLTASLAYSPLRSNWSEHDSVIATAVLAFIFGASAFHTLDWITDPISKRLNEASYGWSSHTGANSLTPAATLADGVAQVADAAAEDAASRAANSAHLRLDLSTTSFLADARRWQGFENGDARLFIAPGVTLFHRETEDAYGIPDREFTLLVGDSEDDSTVITSLAQLHQHLTARAAGLPVAVPVDDTDDDTRGLSAA